MKVTLKDLARECGCSVTTVSRALKDSDTISKELKKKINALAKEMGYIPNQIAGSLRTGTTNTIAFILQDLRNPFYALMAKYIEEYASGLNYSTLILTTREIANKESEIIVTALQKRVDGIILIPSQQEAEPLNILKQSEVPFIILGRIPDDSSIDNVSYDDRQGAYLITKHMLDRGARNIMFINSFMHISSSRYRLEGYLKALQEADIAYSPKNVFNISTNKGETERLINDVFFTPNDYDGLLCYCDIMAYESLSAFKKLGIRVPDDIMVGGIDNIQDDIIYPFSLTSIDFDRQLTAKYIVDFLMNRIHNHQKNDGLLPPQRVSLEPRLVIGDT